MTARQLPEAAEIQAQVRHALQEDIGSGDVTSNLIPLAQQAQATIISREAAAN